VRLRPSLSLALVALSCTACSGGWFGSDEKDPPLEGERIAVLSGKPQLTPDDALFGQSFPLPPAESRLSWPQRGVSPLNYAPPLKGPKISEDSLKVVESTKVGDGQEWDYHLIPQPVIADDVIYSIDAAGVVAAHKAADPAERLWTSYTIAKDDREPLPGGGLAIAGEVLIAVNGAGTVAALSTKNGEPLWERSVQVPVRSAPKIAAGQVYIATVDSQLSVFSLEDGRLLWKHEGMREDLGVLGAPVPAVLQHMVVIPYPSGEVYGLATTNGRELWRSGIPSSTRNSSDSQLSDIAGLPVIVAGKAVLAGQSGLLVVLDLANGMPIWQQETESIKDFWVTESTLFALLRNHHVAAFDTATGRIRWVSKLPVKDEKEDAGWYAPTLLDSGLLLLHPSGHWLTLNPQDGKLVTSGDNLPSEKMTNPVVWQQQLVTVGQSGRLYVIR